MRIARPTGRHQSLRSGAAVGITCLALLAGGLVGGIQTAEAATIPDNPCVSPPAPPPPPVTSRPVLTRVRVSTTVVDVRRHAKTVIVTLKAHDSVPLSRVVLTVARYPWKPAYIRRPATLVSGTATDGTWRASVTVPRGIHDGTYWIGSVHLYDVAGGSANYPPSRLRTRALKTTFLVRSDRDRAAPTVTGFQVSTRAVDTRNGAQALTLRVDAHDHRSGVASVWVSASGTDAALAPAMSAYQGFRVQLSRSATHTNRWTGRVVVPMWVGISTWTMTMTVQDKRRHLRYLNAAALARRGWQSTLRVTSGRDAVAPMLAALSFAPDSVDARNGAVQVDVTYRMTDALSGTSDQSLVGFSGLDVVVTSVTGTANDRTYHGYTLVPQCGSSMQHIGLWYAYLHDDAGNQRALRSDELAGLGFPTELSVRQRDGEAPMVNRAGASVGGPLALGFSEPVIMAEPLAATLRLTVNGSAAPGAWVCRNGSGTAVVCDADGAAVTTATFTPTKPFVSGDQIRVWPISSPPTRSGIYDLDGVPMTQLPIYVYVHS